MNELKNLQPTGLTSLGSALKQTFDLLNVNRLHSGIDNYGQVCRTLCGSKFMHGEIVEGIQEYLPGGNFDLSSYSQTVRCV